MTFYETSLVRARVQIERAVNKFKTRPTEANLAHMIEVFNNRPTDRRALPRVQGWQIVEN